MSEGASVEHRAYDAVRTGLAERRYTEGQMLSTEAVAAESGLPVSAVRTAFERLSEEKALQLYPGQGALVLSLDLPYARAVMEARLLLEIFAIDSVVARGREEARRLGRELAGIVSDVENAQEVLDQGRRFHLRLVEAAGNSVVMRMQEVLWERGLYVAAASTTGPGVREQNVAEHRAIAEALARGEGARARRLVHEHVSAILRRVGVGEDLALPRPADT
ncbi:GntR family transcriptional regulator [Streptomyces zingiberis]|uniref:GntR family transcriptional regulator n=1 Tax=Streptomyces zingiberis TaxID=2053010 RepID=A0ABX1BWU6_9ACTN|nr:GntR family transcriptional regulator [Streptomyces zingiberis]NJQ02121.1 GntR family transcriptional regulator [Streptomyces zingiberis]